MNYEHWIVYQMKANERRETYLSIHVHLIKKIYDYDSKKLHWIPVSFILGHTVLYAAQRSTACTVGPLLSGHQLSKYLCYPAMILQYIVYCRPILSIVNYSLAQDKNKVVNICFILLSNQFYMSDNLLQIE